MMLSKLHGYDVYGDLCVATGEYRAPKKGERFWNGAHQIAYVADRDWPEWLTESIMKCVEGRE